MWVAASMDECLGFFHSKREAMGAVLKQTCLPVKSRKIEAGMYEVTDVGDSQFTMLFWVMTERKAVLNGFEYKEEKENG